ncbi:MAG: hypothetical protein JW891_15295 [Candidatus Lokiarchaeota archaeon]|nr:hypothetical protein [Candidatus Lokiarchaeota archaeon]
MSRKHSEKIKNRVKALFLLITIVFLISTIYIINFANLNESSIDFEKEVKPSAIWANLDLLNTEIDGNRYILGNEIVPLYGRLYHPKLPSQNYIGYTVQVMLDGVLYPSYYNITVDQGYFYILNFSLPVDTNVYVPHTINVSVLNPFDDVNYTNSFTIYGSTASYFDNVIVDNAQPYYSGESIDVSGSLLLGDDTGVSNEPIYAGWYDNLNNPVYIFGSPIDNTGLDGTFTTSVQTPDASGNLTLRLSYSNPPIVTYSEIDCSNIFVFQNITLTNPSTSVGVAGQEYTISGRLASVFGNFYIFNRAVTVVYNDSSSTYGLAQTDSQGRFTCMLTLPNVNGTASYQVYLNSSSGLVLAGTVPDILINAAPVTPSGGPTGQIPFADFFMVFIPIVVVIGAALAGYGYYFLKKQRKASLSTTIPLEKKISNLKILKETGRLEEALSYLFNAIFMTLIDGKYGRKKKEFETIRDFAIVSVKEFKMKPTVVYPFMTKVEEIIYSRPFEMTESDFYSAIELFSRVYFDLTGYNFVLKF